MNTWTHLMIHCSDTPASCRFDRSDIEQWHLVERGWSRVGYSMIFLLDGTTDILIPFDRDDIIESWEISNGAKGWNGRTKHLCYIGGKDGVDTRTSQQKAALEAVIKMHIMLWPNIKVIGHNQVNRGKYCPSYDVPSWSRSIGIDERNIDSNIYYKTEYH